jgi:hypothetical protein
VRERFLQIGFAFVQGVIERVGIQQRTKPDRKDRRNSRCQVGHDSLVALQSPELRRRHVSATLDHGERIADAMDREWPRQPGSGAPGRRAIDEGEDVEAHRGLARGRTRSAAHSNADSRM